MGWSSPLRAGEELNDVGDARLEERMACLQFVMGYAVEEADEVVVDGAQDNVIWRK